MEASQVKKTGYDQSQPLLAALLIQHFEKGSPNKTAGGLEHGPYNKNHRVPKKSKHGLQISIHYWS